MTLPVDYARPSLAAFLAASKAHTAAEHLPWCERYEAALRRHSAPAVGAPEPVAAPATPELATLGDPDQPWEYVRDAGGIITGTRSLAPSAEASGSELAPVELSKSEPMLTAFAEFVLAATGHELADLTSSTELAALTTIYGWGPGPSQAREYREAHKLESWAAVVAQIEGRRSTDNAPPAPVEPSSAAASKPEAAPVEPSSAAVSKPEAAPVEPSSAAVSEPEPAADPLAKPAT